MAVRDGRPRQEVQPAPALTQPSLPQLLVHLNILTSLPKRGPLLYFPFMTINIHVYSRGEDSEGKPASSQGSFDISIGGKNNLNEVLRVILQPIVGEAWAL